MIKPNLKVSIVVPARNEEKFIGPCIESFLTQSYPTNLLEIIIVDGASDDKTKDIVSSYARKISNVKLFHNPQKFTPISKNIGIKNASGDIIMICGAHSKLSNNYIEKCVDYLVKNDDIDAVGGVLDTRPAAETLSAKSIVLVLKHSFGTGGSRFRSSVRGIQEADTLFNPCYRREVFQKIGLYNENLIGSQDYDLNLRLKKSGSKLILLPDISAVYYPKATLKAFFRHNIKDGTWAILPMKYGAPPFKLRHLIPLFFVIGVFVPLLLSIWYKPFIYLTVAVLVLYLLASLYFSVCIAASEKKLILLPFLVAAFALRHFGYGFGSLVGLVKLIL